jgi:mono/diheme cytochrome c family protein
MHDQPKYKPYRASALFPDGRSDRPLVPGTIARGHLREDDALYAGKSGDALAETIPLAVTKDLLQRGRVGFDAYCAPCHGRVGDGDGMIVQRGYRRPPSYHIDRLRTAPVGYYYDVITKGFGVMPDYAGQVSVNDRWAITAYIRALQLSQNAVIADVPADKRQELTNGQ